MNELDGNENNRSSEPRSDPDNEPDTGGHDAVPLEDPRSDANSSDGPDTGGHDAVPLEDPRSGVRPDAPLSGAPTAQAGTDVDADSEGFLDDFDIDINGVYVLNESDDAPAMNDNVSNVSARTDGANDAAPSGGQRSPRGR